MTSPGFEGCATARVRGTTLAYRENGQGEPLVFVHGGISDLRMWDGQLPELGRSYRAIAYSRRYARPNAPNDPDGSDPIRVHVEDLVAFLREVGAEPAHLVGNSWGALVCLLTALGHPGCVRSLVLEEPPAVTLFVPTVPPRAADLLRLVVTRPRTALALFRFTIGTLAPVQRAYARGDDDEAVRLFARGVLGRKPLEALPQAVREQMLENGADLRPILLRPDADPPRLKAEALRGLRIPVLLLTGELSPPYLLRLSDRLGELLPGAERVEIPGASHIMHAEEPAAVNRAILDFLERHAAKGAPGGDPAGR